MKAEQLALSGLQIPEAGPVAVVLFLKDADTKNPKVLIAKRPNGQYTFPGGKLKAREYKRPARGGRREMGEETGIQIYDDESLVESHVSPKRIAVDGVERNMHFFYAFSDEAASSDKPQLLEPTKNGPWRYVLIRRLPYLVAAGKMHMLAVGTDMEVIAMEAREAALQPRQMRRTERMFKDLARRGLYTSHRREYGFLEYIHDRDAARYAATLAQ